MESLVGFSDGCLVTANCWRTAAIPSLLGMLVYRLVTSRVQRITLSGSWRLFSSQRKCPLSLI